MNSPAYGILENPKGPTYAVFKSRVIKDTQKNNICWELREPTTPEIEKDIFNDAYTYVLSHIIHTRSIDLNDLEGVSESPHAGLVYDIVKKTLEYNGLKLGTIFRSALNLTPRSRSDKIERSEPHVDATYQHFVMLVYFNTTSGSTHLCCEKHDSDKQIKDHGDVSVLASIEPEEDKIIIFEGSRFHFNDYPKSDDPLRLVLVINFSLA